jgi:hypothetical protein
VEVEAARLLEPDPPPPARRLAETLLGAIRVGDHRRAAALCPALAVGPDEACLRALETACRSDDRRLRIAAMRSLHRSAPERAAPFVREAVEDPRFPIPGTSGGEGREEALLGR